VKRCSVLLLLLGMLCGCAFQFSGQGNRLLTPRGNASLQLTQEGTELLNAGKPDNAIRLFEQAIGLDANNGQCYYYMAQAWLVKGVQSEAREFNSLARDYLKDDADWTNRVDRQAYQIERLPK
jgi:Tfp pilus assembly protein PilF